MQDLKATGKDAAYLPDADAIIAAGGGAEHRRGIQQRRFRGPHGKLLDRSTAGERKPHRVVLERGHVPQSNPRIHQPKLPLDEMASGWYIFPA